MNDRDPPDEYAPRGRPSRYDDIRDDYDDEFRSRWTPLEVARRKVTVPAHAFIVIGVIGIVGMGVAAFAVILEYMQSRRFVPILVIGLYLWLLFLAACLFATVIVGGLNLLRRRRRWLALTAAYIVTGLALAGPYGLPFFPFGIWALVVLYQPDVREQFRRPPASVSPEGDR